MAKYMKRILGEKSKLFFNFSSFSQSLYNASVPCDSIRIQTAAFDHRALLREHLLGLMLRGTPVWETLREYLRWEVLFSLNTFLGF